MRAMVVLLSVMVVPVVSAQAPARPEILVLGTFHMANPGRDVHNIQADDVLAPKRQREIAEVIEVLKRFRPTRIAIESDPGGQRPAQYADYVAGRYTLTRNEIDQLGFRLAKELGHSKIYPVDEGGEFPFYRVRNYAIANGMKARFDSMQATAAAAAKQEQEFLRTHTVLEVLEFMNADSTAAKGVASYYAYVPFGEPYEYAGPDLLAAWFQRNIRIYHNIHALATSPNDRVLVIYGAGHLGWLQQDIANDPTVRLGKLADLTERTSGRP